MDCQLQLTNYVINKISQKYSLKIMWGYSNAESVLEGQISFDCTILFVES